MSIFSFCSVSSETPSSSRFPPHPWGTVLQAVLVLVSVAVVPSAAEKTVSRTQTRGHPSSTLAPPFMEQEEPGFLLRQLELLDHLRVGTDLKEAIRHQRQIKFKSSYAALPVALRLAAEQRNSGGAGKSFDEGNDDDDEVQVILDDSSSSSRESSALKDLPPSSEIYFTPEVEPRKGSRGKNLNQVDQTPQALSQNNPFRFRTKQPPNKLNDFSFKKQGRVVMKKMVGKKLLRSGPPKPEKIEQFQVSSTENIENKVKSKHQSSRGEPFSPSGARTNGGPNPEESFKNPYYVETPPNAVSSYSFVPENSMVKSHKRGKTLDQQHQSATPKPSRLSHTKPGSTLTPQNKPRQQITKQQLQVKNIPSPTQKAKSLRPLTITKKHSISHKNTDEKIVLNRKHSQEGFQSWDHFLGAPIRQKEQSTPTLRHGSNVENENHNSRPPTPSASNLVGNPKSSSTFRRGKSFSDNLLPMLQKMSPTKSGYPNLVRVPMTNFRCGSYTGGEYFADVETNCQVFHVCYGGRQASFVCPVGTAFSQQLLVCDWWNKVQCGGEFTRSQRSVKLSDLLWHPMNAFTTMGPITGEETSLITDIIDSQGTETPPTVESLITESPYDESTQVTNSPLVPLETQDEGLRDRFLNRTIELVGLDLSTSNETIVNTSHDEILRDRFLNSTSKFMEVGLSTSNETFVNTSHDESLGDRFLNSTSEVIGLGHSTSNETFANTSLDERLRDRFLNSTSKVIDLGHSTSNETFVNTTETASVANADESPHEAASDV